jgi:hypothetical protein
MSWLLVGVLQEWWVQYCCSAALEDSIRHFFLLIAGMAILSVNDQIQIGVNSSGGVHWLSVFDIRYLNIYAIFPNLALLALRRLRMCNSHVQQLSPSIPRTSRSPLSNAWMSLAAKRPPFHWTSLNTEQVGWMMESRADHLYALPNRASLIPDRPL